MIFRLGISRKVKKRRNFHSGAYGKRAREYALLGYDPVCGNALFSYFA